MCESEEDLLNRHVFRDRGAIRHVGHAVGSFALLGRDRFDPDPPPTDLRVELRTLVAVPRECYTVVLKSDGEIHLPESLRKFARASWRKFGSARGAWSAQRLSHSCDDRSGKDNLIATGANTDLV